MREPRPAQSRRDPLDFAGRDVAGPLDRDVARRTVRISALLAAGASFSYLPLYQLSGPSEFILPNTVAGIALVVVAFAPFRDWNRRMYAGVTVGLALLAVQLLLLGRIDTGSTVWFLVPPLAAMLVGARRMAVYSALTALVVIVVVVLARELGWPILGDVVLPRPDLVMAFSVVGAIITTGAVADVTLRARRTLMADVETRTIDLAAALQEARAARAEAVEAAEAKDRFFANLTHEIRTPLNGIAGTAELLHAAPLAPEEQAMTDALLASTRNLVALVNTMLAHARLRAGRVGVDRHPLEIRALAADVEALFRAQAADMGLALRVTVVGNLPAWVETDGVKVLQIVDNLVGNAIKFTEHGQVDVAFAHAAGTTGSGDGRLVVTVADSGAGIAPGLVESIFEPFVQGDPSITRGHGGTGLGLAIASQLAGVLGGSLQVASRAGEGSVFTLDIPVGAAEAPLGGTAPTPRIVAPGPGVRVLLAEDNAVNRTVASRMLEKLGADVLVADGGVRAVELVREGGIGLVLMDLQMPGMDGITAAGEIRRWEAETGAHRVPIVAMTGNAPEDYGDACAAAGMDAFLTKPVDLAHLRDLLGRVSTAPADSAQAGS